MLQNFKHYLPFLQLFSSIIFIILILLQQRGTTFGGSGGFYATRRGIQKNIFFASIFFGILFVVFALLNLIL
jgi:preprotein translocase subunit SecG